MAGRTISAYVDEKLARRLERLAEVEDRKISRLVAAALSLYASLPQEAHAALRRIEATGERQDIERAARQVARVLLDVQYDVARREVIESMDSSEFGGLDTEEELLDAAKSVAAHRNGGGTRVGTGAGSDRPAGDPLRGSGKRPAPGRRSRTRP